MTCLTCNNEHNEKFCPNCGEKSTVKKITFSSIISNAFSTFLQMDKGFLFNLKTLTLRPKEIITGYIEGKRKDIFNPISFLILSVTIYLILDSFVKHSSSGTKLNSRSFEIGAAGGQFIKAYFKYFWILGIIWLATSTKIIFRKYNFAEHLTIASFIIGYATLFALPVRLFFGFPLLFNPVIYLVCLWLIYQVFKYEHCDKVEIMGKAFVCVILFFIQLFGIVILIGLAKTI